MQQHAREDDDLREARSRNEKRARAKLSSEEAAQYCRERMLPPTVDFQISGLSIPIKESYRYLGVQFFNPAIFADALTKSLNVRATIAIHQVKKQWELLNDHDRDLEMKLLVAHGGICSTATYGMAMGGVALLGLLTDLECFKNLQADQQAALSKDILNAGGAPNVSMLNSLDAMLLQSVAGLSDRGPGFRSEMDLVGTDTSLACLQAEYEYCPMRLQLVAKLVALVTADSNPLLDDEASRPLPGGSQYSLKMWMEIRFKTQFDNARDAAARNDTPLNPSKIARSIKKRIHHELLIAQDKKKSHSGGPSKSLEHREAGFLFTNSYCKHSLLHSEHAGAINDLATLRNGSYRRVLMYKLKQHFAIPDAMPSCLLCDGMDPDTLGHLLCRCQHPDLIDMRNRPVIHRQFAKAARIIDSMYTARDRLLKPLQHCLHWSEMT